MDLHANRHHGELLKYKLLLEKAKQDEKETKRLLDNVQALQLRLQSREQTRQEKFRELENQLAEEKKIRAKQESRALASISSQSALSASTHAQKTSTDKKPALTPSISRRPLRKITNFMPMSTPVQPKKNGISVLPRVSEDEEIVQPSLKGGRASPILQASRGSIAVRPSPAAHQILQPKRRAFVATLRPESSSNMSTPLQCSSLRSRTDRVMGRQ